jgi:hypothetical protein
VRDRVLCASTLWASMSGIGRSYMYGGTKTFSGGSLGGPSSQGMRYQRSVRQMDNDGEGGVRGCRIYDEDAGFSKETLWTLNAWLSGGGVSYERWRKEVGVGWWV